MKPLIITGDITALGGIIAWATHLVPEVAGGFASMAAFVWYSVMLFDRFRNKRNDYESKS